MLTALQARGMLCRETKPTPDMVRELLLSIANQISCNSCGAIGVAVDDHCADEWTDEVRCGGCEAVISPERLEVFPNAKFCPTCQSKQESGEDAGPDVEYCLHCGGIMKLTKRDGAGLSGYQLVCRDCGKIR